MHPYCYRRLYFRPSSPDRCCSKSGIYLASQWYPHLTLCAKYAVAYHHEPKELPLNRASLVSSRLTVVLFIMKKDWPYSPPDAKLEKKTGNKRKLFKWPDGNETSGYGRPVGGVGRALTQPRSSGVYLAPRSHSERALPSETK